MKHSSDKSFENDVINETGLVLVDFWAEWCGPCKQISPILEDIDTLYENLTIIKFNVDENPKTPTKYGIRGIPALIIFKDGNIVDSKIGSIQKSKLTEWIEQTIEG